jgi:ParB-like chromosome segregation protein Spo0J|tara:strand:+ start:1711 stop:2331 length:621 start_codon:yes stop_codon:yes gene_type:complete
MKVEQIKIEEILPYDQNPRDNSAAVEKVADSIKEFGWQQPIVVDEEKIILAGHTRHLAALSMGVKEVPVLIAKGLTEAQKKAYRIVDNKTSELAEWDKELLKSEFLALQELDFDLNLTGFDLDEIAKLSGEDLMQFDEELDEIDNSLEFNDLDGANANHVKSLMLYLDTETEPKFKQMCMKIQEKHGIDNLTDAVYMAVSNECKDL